MSDSTLVSILIPTFNRSWGLKLALESALAQSYLQTEIIVTDDASADDTESVVAAFSAPNLVYKLHERRLGMVGNWGSALALAKGKFVCFLADDDRLDRNFVEDRVIAFNQNSGVDVVFGQFQVKRPDGTTVCVVNDEGEQERLFESTELLRSALARHWFIGTSLYLKAKVEELWPQIGKDDLVLDMGLNVRLALGGGRGVFLPKADSFILAHPGQNSQAKIGIVFSQTETALCRILQTHRVRAEERRLMCDELANWQIVRARWQATEGRKGQSLKHLTKSLRYRPLQTWAWKEMLRCLVPK